MSDKPKKDPSDKMKALIAARADARAQLTAALGKGARVANAASFVSKPPAERNLAAFVEQIKRRDAAAAELKSAAKGAEKKINAVKKEVKVIAKTAKKNAKLATAVTNTVKKNLSRNKTKKVKYHTFKYDSVERQAKKLVKEANELQQKLDSVDVKLKDVCKMCADFKESTPSR